MSKVRKTSDIVDELGILQAEIAPLALREEALKNELRVHGFGPYTGEFYDATVSPNERDKIDWEAIKPKISRQLLAAHTSHEIGKPRVTVKARVARRSNPKHDQKAYFVR